MPKLVGEYIQEPLALYPVVADLNASDGVVTATYEDLEWADPEKRGKLARMVRAYGELLGPTESVDANHDLILDIAIEDFQHASPLSIKSGLYIYPDDPRYSSSFTEQLVRIGSRKGNPHVPSVVFPSDEYSKVAHSARGLTSRNMNKARLSAGKKGLGPTETELLVGRAAANILTSYIGSLDGLDKNLEKKRTTMLAPLYKETNTWVPHFKIKNLDKRRREFDEEVHHILDTASLNLNIGSIALKGAHRALASNLYRQGKTPHDINHQWRRYLHLTRDYVRARRQKIQISREECELELQPYLPFLEPKSA